MSTAKDYTKLTNDGLIEIAKYGDEDGAWRAVSEALSRQHRARKTTCAAYEAAKDIMDRCENAYAERFGSWFPF